MGKAQAKRVYTYVGVHPEIDGRAPFIEGTRITVRTIAGYYQMGMSVNEILTALPHLTPAKVHSALAFYFDHQTEVDDDRAVATDIDFWKEQTLKYPRQS